MDGFDVRLAAALRGRRKSRLRMTALYSPYTQQRTVKNVPSLDSVSTPVTSITQFENIGPASSHYRNLYQPGQESLRPNVIYPVSPWPPILYNPGGGTPEFSPSKQEREVRPEDAPPVGKSQVTQNTQGWGDPTNLYEYGEPEFPPPPKMRKYERKKDEGD